LQPVASPDLLVATIAEAVGCRLSGSAAPRVQLRNFLRERSLLLLLDNFEHLLAGAELLGELLAAAPSLRLLVTTREVLNLQEEWSYPLNGLPVPPEAEPLSSPEQYAAVALFAERARRARPTFSLADEHAEVSHICRLVDGIPLAIELAAAWTAALGCRQIAIEIERNLAFLATRQRNAPERHRSMRAVFDSSWALLDQKHRTCFSRLAIIRGGFTADAALHVADASPAVLATLVDKSLLQLEAGGRYQIHELLRQYAAEQLEAQPADAAQAREAHCNYYLAFLAERDEAVSSGRDVVRTAEIAAELENVRLAWQHAVARGEPQRIGRGINVLANFYLYRGPYEEGAAACEQVIQSLRRAPESTARELLLAEALHEQAWLYLNVGELAAARSGLELTLQIYDQLGMAPPSNGRASHPWSGLALLALFAGDYAEAARLVEAYLCLSETAAYSGQRPFAWFLVARTALAQGLYARARHAAERAYVAVQAEEDRWFEAYVLLDLGRAMLALGQHHEARSHFQASYAIREAFGDPEGKALALYYEGRAALLQGALPSAAELFARSLAIYQSRGDVRGIAEARLGQGMASLALGEETAAADAYREALSLAWQTSLAPLILAALVCAAELLLARGRSRQAHELLVLVLRHPAADHETSARAQALLVANEQPSSEPPLAAAGILALPVLDDPVARTLAELAVLAQPQPSGPAAAPVPPPASGLTH
jgi:predicted ATPase